MKRAFSQLLPVTVGGEPDQKKQKTATLSWSEDKIDKAVDRSRLAGAVVLLNTPDMFLVYFPKALLSDERVKLETALQNHDGWHQEKFMGHLCPRTVMSFGKEGEPVSDRRHCRVFFNADACSRCLIPIRWPERNGWSCWMGLLGRALDSALANLRSDV